jgi:hypothetical protein
VDLRGVRLTWAGSRIVGEVPGYLRDSASVVNVSHTMPMDSWSEIFSIQLENAKWLLDRESARIDGFHQRASYLLGFAGVILAILPMTLDPIGKIANEQARWCAWVLVSLSAVLLAVGALFSLLTLTVRKALNLGIKQLQQNWVEWTRELDNPNAAQVLADLTNAVMGRTSNAQDSALLAVRSEGDVRAIRLRISMWCSTCGVIALAGMFLVLVATTIWP